MTTNCCICGEELSNIEEVCCEDCAHRLDKQRETGRCGWCGQPVEECVCDEYD